MYKKVVRGLDTLPNLYLIKRNISTPVFKERLEALAYTSGNEQNKER